MTFITVEGLDGSGGTTVVDAISERYKNAVITQEPSDLWTGEAVRRCIEDEDSNPLTDFYIFMGDRVNHIEQTVKPVDEAGSLVISDRYADSTRAYQPVALAQSAHFESQTTAKIFIEQTMAPWNYEPDKTLYLDVSVDTALERCDEADKYEKREFLEQVKENYDALVASESERFTIIDGEQPKEVVRREALDRI